MTPPGGATDPSADSAGARHFSREPPSRRRGFRRGGGRVGRAHARGGRRAAVGAGPARLEGLGEGSVSHGVAEPCGLSSVASSLHGDVTCR